MCQRVTCPECRKPSFAGCGAHVEQVLGDVPVAQRCQCKSGDAGRAPRAGVDGTRPAPGFSTRSHSR